MEVLISIRRFLCVILLGLSAAQAQEMLDQVIVIVEDDVITAAELDQRLRIIAQQIQQTDTPLPPIDQLRRQVLEHMVLSLLQIQQAERIGIGISPKELMDEINTLAQRNQLSIEDFQRQVERTGIKFPHFVRYIRDQMLTQRVQRSESRRLVRVTEEEIENFLRLHADLLQSEARYHLGHILIALPENAGPAQAREAQARTERLRERILGGENFASVALTESDGRNALKGGDLGWRKTAALPAIAAQIIPSMAPGELTEVLKSASGFHLFKLIDQESGEQIMVHQTLSRHILLRTHAMVDEAEAKARLYELKQRIEVGGEDFAELAQSHSDDTASAVDGGDLGWRSPGELDPLFEEQMDRLQPNEVSDPFQSSFGWHIVQVLDRRKVDETQQTLRQRALNYLANSRVNEEVEVWLQRLLENSYVQYLTADASDA